MFNFILSASLDVSLASSSNTAPVTIASLPFSAEEVRNFLYLVKYIPYVFLKIRIALASPDDSLFIAGSVTVTIGPDTVEAVTPSDDITTSSLNEDCS
jgi:hypothetical protein